MQKLWCDLQQAEVPVIMTRRRRRLDLQADHAHRPAQPVHPQPQQQQQQTPQQTPHLHSSMATTTNGAAAGQQPVWAVPGVDVTNTRPPPVGLDDTIPHPGMPRANKAISKEMPGGSPDALSRPDYTVLQQHVAFWDADNDGIIWPWDTYIGFRKLGFGRIISSLAVPFIHGSFSYASCPTILPDPFLRIFIKNMHRTKHGSDSEVYDTEGRFVPEKFEEIFSKFDRSNKGGLSWDDIQAMVLANMNVLDPVGWIAERMEWWMFYLLAADDNGVISKEKVRGQFDGSLWYKIAEEVKAKEAARKQAAKAKWQ